MDTKKEGEIASIQRKQRQNMYDRLKEELKVVEYELTVF